MRSQREDPLRHFEGDTHVDEVYGEEDEEEHVEEEEQVEEEEKVEEGEEEQVEQEQEPTGGATKKNKPRKGPTKRSHASLEQRFEHVWVPSSDEERDVGNLKHEYE
ncbi:hypothetical protein D1007_55049 [Hordeum vulgare]|nr:hypothetical protein D1007_55049 [Hordeum vulgare]